MPEERIPTERNYPLLDKLILVGVALEVVLCIFLLPMTPFLNSVLGAVLGIATFVAYAIVRPSDEEIELLKLMSDTVEKTEKLRSKPLRNIMVDIAITIYTEGVLKQKQEVRHLNELVISASLGVEENSLMPVLEKLKVQVETDQRRQFQRAQERTDFLARLYGSKGKSSEAIRILNQILEKKSE